MTTFQIAGQRLRWAKATLNQAGISVQGIRRKGSGYALVVADGDAPRAQAALLAVQSHRAKRKPLELRAMQGLIGAGLVAAVPVALVTPLAGAVLLAMAGVFRFVFPRLAGHGRVLRAAGGWYGVAAIVGMVAALLAWAAIVGGIGAVAVMQLGAGHGAIYHLGE